MIKLKLDKEVKERLISDIQQFIYNEQGEEIGRLAAEQYYDFFKEKLGPLIYNQALYDARVLMEQKMMSLEEDFYTLEKRMR
jgi:uncharacterized protein (DUF2164 family)